MTGAETLIVLARFAPGCAQPSALTCDPLQQSIHCDRALEFIDVASARRNQYRANSGTPRATNDV